MLCFLGEVLRARGPENVLIVKCCHCESQKLRVCEGKVLATGTQAVVSCKAVIGRQLIRGLAQVRSAQFSVLCSAYVYRLTANYERDYA